MLKKKKKKKESELYGLNIIFNMQLTFLEFPVASYLISKPEDSLWIDMGGTHIFSFMLIATGVHACNIIKHVSLAIL